MKETLSQYPYTIRTKQFQQIHIDIGEKKFKKIKQKQELKRIKNLFITYVMYNLTAIPITWFPTSIQALIKRQKRYILGHKERKFNVLNVFT